MRTDFTNRYKCIWIPFSGNAQAVDTSRFLSSHMAWERGYFDHI